MSSIEFLHVSRWILSVVVVLLYSVTECDQVSEQLSGWDRLTSAVSKSTKYAPWMTSKGISLGLNNILRQGIALKNRYTPLLNTGLSTGLAALFGAHKNSWLQGALIGTGLGISPMMIYANLRIQTEQRKEYFWDRFNAIKSLVSRLSVASDISKDDLRNAQLAIDEVSALQKDIDDKDIQEKVEELKQIWMSLKRREQRKINFWDRFNVVNSSVSHLGSSTISKNDLRDVRQAVDELTALQKDVDDADALKEVKRLRKLFRRHAGAWEAKQQIQNNTHKQKNKIWLSLSHAIQVAKTPEQARAILEKVNKAIAAVNKSTILTRQEKDVLKNTLMHTIKQKIRNF